MNRIARMLRVVGAVIAAVTIAIAFISNFLRLPETVPVPVSDVQAVVADSTGRIFVALGAYERVSIYDPSGHFLRSINVPPAKGPLRLAMDVDDRLWTCEGPFLRRWTRDGNADGAWLLNGPSACDSVGLGAEGDWLIVPLPDVTVQTLDVVEPGAASPMFPRVNFALFDEPPQFVDTAGRTYSMEGRFWLGLVRRHGGGAPDLTLWGPAWLLPIAFPSPGIPLGLLLFALGFHHKGAKSTKS